MVADNNYNHDKSSCFYSFQPQHPRFKIFFFKFHGNPYVTATAAAAFEAFAAAKFVFQTAIRVSTASGQQR